MIVMENILFVYVYIENVKDVCLGKIFVCNDFV